jgi:hypothetical protein
MVCRVNTILQRNRWEICLRMRYNLRGLREKRLVASKYSNVIFNLIIIIIERFIESFWSRFSC